MAQTLDLYCSHQILSEAQRTGTTIHPTVPMTKKEKLRDVKPLAQGHRAGKWQNPGWNSQCAALISSPGVPFAAEDRGQPFKDQTVLSIILSLDASGPDEPQGLALFESTDTKGWGREAISSLAMNWAPPSSQHGPSQVLGPKDVHVRAKNKVPSRPSWKEQDVQGHSRYWASMFKSKGLSPARRTAHPGPSHSTHSWHKKRLPLQAVLALRRLPVLQHLSQPRVLFPALSSATPSLSSSLLLRGPITWGLRTDCLQLCLLQLAVFPTCGTAPGTQQVPPERMLQAQVPSEKTLACKEDAAHTAPALFSHLVPALPCAGGSIP